MRQRFEFKKNRKFFLTKNRKLWYPESWIPGSTNSIEKIFSFLCIFLLSFFATMVFSDHPNNGIERTVNENERTGKAVFGAGGANENH